MDRLNAIRDFLKAFECHQELLGKLRNSKCPRKEKIEIVKISSAIERFFYRYTNRSVFHLPHWFDQYERVVTNLRNGEEPDWKEVKEELKQILQSYTETKDRMELQCLYEKRCRGVDESVTISVEELDGTHHFIEGVRKTDSTDSLIGKIEDKTGIPRSIINLIHNGDFLKPGQSLANFNLHEGSVVALFPVKEGQQQPTNIKGFVLGIFKGLYGQIENLFRKFPQVFQDCSRLLCEKDYVKISQLIGNWWQLLGTELGLDAATLDHIKSDYPKERLRIVEMLRQWNRNSPLEATAGNLFGAIKNCGVKCDFEKLKRAVLIGI